MYWQKSGSYLCVRVNRTTKSGKTVFVNLEVFRLHEKDVPVDTLKLDDRVMYVAWEPNGRRLAVVHAASLEAAAPNVSVYNVASTIELVKTLEAKKTNALFWSPRGKYLIIAGTAPLPGRLEFWNARDMKLIATDDHFQMNQIEWDPTGRYLATAACRNQLEHGFKIWSFDGRLLHEASIDNFHLFRWRPRPQSLLSAEQHRELQRTLPVKSQEYDKIDYLRAQALDSESREKRRAMYSEFTDLRSSWAARRDDIAAARLRLFGAPKTNLVRETRQVDVLLEELVLTQEDQ